MPVNPRMITLAREVREWTQKDLARAISATQGQISKYEHGVLAVPQQDLEAISEQLEFDPSFFSRPDQVYGLGGDFLYRRRAHVPARAKRRIEAEANLFMMRIAELLKSAEVADTFPFPEIQPEEYKGNIRRIAREVRKAWRLPPGPVDNLTRIIERAGGIVLTLDFGTRLIDGTNIRIPGFPPLLFLNKNVSGERHRYNLAHELGHVIMHFTYSLGDAEDQAHAFASEFLMPKAEIARDLSNINLHAALRLKSVWGVSMAALIKRARDLRKISAHSYRMLFMALGAKEMRLVEPHPVAFEQPEVYDKLIRMHKTELGLSGEQMKVILFTDRLGHVEPKKRPELRVVDYPRSE